MVDDEFRYFEGRTLCVDGIDFTFRRTTTRINIKGIIYIEVRSQPSPVHLSLPPLYLYDTREVVIRQEIERTIEVLNKGSYMRTVRMQTALGIKPEPYASEAWVADPRTVWQERLPDTGDLVPWTTRKKDH